MLPVIVAAVLPLLFWEQGPESAAALKQAQIPCVAVPAASAASWSATVYCAKGVDMERLEPVPVPGMRMRTRGAGTASATVAPWVDSNGWRFQLHPDGKFLYKVPAGRGRLAAAEAFAFGADAVLQIAPEELNGVGELLGFLQSVPEVQGLAPASNIAVVNNKSPLLPEALNLLARRNLLYRVVDAPDRAADLNVEIGSKLFPQSESTNPVYVAERARELLTDRKRLLRIYNTETVLGRLLTGRNAARLHLVNYSPGKAEALRVRVAGAYKDVRLRVFGAPDVKATDVLVRAGGTEFSVPQMGVYAVVDLVQRTPPLP